LAYHVTVAVKGWAAAYGRRVALEESGSWWLRSGGYPNRKGRGCFRVVIVVGRIDRRNGVLPVVVMAVVASDAAQR